MTDSMDAIAGGGGLGDGTVPGEPGEFAVVPPTGRRCQRAGCTEGLDGGPGPIPDGSAPARKYCDAHFVGAKGKNRAGTTKREKAPKLVLELGGNKGKGKDAAAVETAQGATAFMKVLAAGMASSGDLTCATAIAQGAEPWGQAVGELSKYQPFLQKFFAPAGGDSQLGAWLGFMLTTGAIALPVLAHHGLLPDSLGARMGGVFIAAEQAGGSGVPGDTGVPGAA
jgi:hypothetical protein